MRALVVAIVVSMALGACSSSSKPSVATTTTAGAESLAAFAARVSDGKATEQPAVNGHQVFADDSSIYVLDCAVGRQLTREGAPYGPSARAADGSFKAGKAFVCPS